MVLAERHGTRAENTDCSVRSTYTKMSTPREDELHNNNLEDHHQDPVTSHAGFGDRASMESQHIHQTTPPNKELEGNASKTASSISLAQRTTHDEEKGLPVDGEDVKEPAVTDTEHDSNIVDWDGEHDPENPLNWSAKKKWLSNCTVDHQSSQH
jgi:hypothetical protein